ncbi:MAG: SH3 domain-containing protein [Chloroflexi bacterium]|nr:SH3 domain-containing protein [Chloroflexota bacterium]
MERKVLDRPDVKPIALDRVSRLPWVAPPAGYIILILDVDYGSRYKIARHQQLDRHQMRRGADLPFETRVARIWQADDAAAAELALHDEIAAGTAIGEWFELDHDQAQEMRDSNAEVRPGQQSRRQSRSFSSLLKPSVSQSPRQRSTARRRTDATRSVPSRSQAGSSRQRSTAHRRSDAAVNVSARDRRSHGQSAEVGAVGPATELRRSGRRGQFVRFIILLLLLGSLYSLIAQRDAVDELRRWAETALSRSGIAQSRPAPAPLRLAARFARASHNSVRFEWTRAAGAHFYQYRYSVNGAALTRWTNISLLGKTIADLSPGDRVIFHLRARQEGGYSPITRITANALPKPTDTPAPLRLAVRFAKASHDSVRFEWTEEAGALGYLYRYSVNGGAFTNWRNTNFLGTTIASLSPGDRVIFHLRARQEGGYSPIAATSASALPKPTATDTATDLPPTVTSTATDLPPTATSSATDMPPTTTSTETDVPTTPTSSATDLPPTATSSATEPPPTSTYTATAASRTRAVIETQRNLNANIRACPRTSCDIVDKLAPGTEVEVVGSVTGETVYDTDVWLEIRLESGSAFIHSELVAEQE